MRGMERSSSPTKRRHEPSVHDNGGRSRPEASARPTVSIGLPVFNGEKYLDEALRSILAQSFRDFELIICDNASTDQTRAICEGYAAIDPRIRYYRSENHIGGGRNANLT